MQHQDQKRRWWRIPTPTLWWLKWIHWQLPHYRLHICLKETNKTKRNVTIWWSRHTKELLASYWNFYWSKHFLAFLPFWLQMYTTVWKVESTRFTPQTKQHFEKCLLWENFQFLLLFFRSMSCSAVLVKKFSDQNYACCAQSLYKIFVVSLEISKWKSLQQLSLFAPPPRPNSTKWKRDKKPFVSR